MIKIIFRILIILIAGLLFLYKCVEPFQPEIEKYEDLLVIDGFISNEEVPYEVYLSRTSTLEDNQLGVSGAILKIIVDDGEETILVEDNKIPGLYRTQTGSIIGTTGKKYKLSIDIEGKKYESDFESMTIAPEIDTVHYTFFNEILEKDGSQIPIEGINIEVNASGDENVSDYVFWEYIETWKIDVPFATKRSEDKQICYVSKKSKEFLFAGMNNYKNKKLKDFKLYSIDNRSNRLTLSYSTEIKQYGINDKTYQYYKKQKDQKNNVGSLFDKTPIAIIGNIQCISNPEEPVLGLFRVAAMNSKRIFVYNEDIADKVNAVVDVEGCSYEQYVIGQQDDMIQDAMNRGLVIMDSIKIGQFLEMRLVTTPLCFDCTFGGGVTTPPDFWVEKYEDK